MPSDPAVAPAAEPSGHPGGVRAAVRATPRPPRRLVAAAAIIAEGAVLAARRTAPPAVAGRWELPGGKVEPGESPERAAVREVQEELGVAVRAGRRLGRRHPIRPGLSLVVVLAELLEPAPTTSVVHDRLRWLRADQLEEVDWLPADRPVLELLRAVLSVATPPATDPPAPGPAPVTAGRRRRGSRVRRRRSAAPGVVEPASGSSPADPPEQIGRPAAVETGGTPGGR